MKEPLLCVLTLKEIACANLRADFVGRDEMASQGTFCRFILAKPS